MKLQVLPYALRTQKFYTFQTHVPNDLRRMGITVIGGDRVGLADGAGGGKEGARVGVGVAERCVAVETGVLLIEKVHCYDD